jgi:hypothetical protein
MSDQERSKVQSVDKHIINTHKTISLQRTTKAHLKYNKVLSQSYDEFINQMIDYWERYRIGSSLCGPGKPITHEIER